MAVLKDFGVQGFNYEIAREYLKGKTIEFSKPPYIDWTPVMPYDEPEDIVRISNEQYMFRAVQKSITMCIAWDDIDNVSFIDDSPASVHNVRITFDDHGNPESMERIEGGCI